MCSFQGQMNPTLSQHPIQCLVPSRFWSHQVGRTVSLFSGTQTTVPQRTRMANLCRFRVLMSPAIFHGWLGWESSPNRIYISSMESLPWSLYGVHEWITSPSIIKPCYCDSWRRLGQLLNLPWVRILVQQGLLWCFWWEFKLPDLANLIFLAWIGKPGSKQIP